MAKPELIVARACNYKTKQELCMTFRRTLLTFQAVCVLLIAALPHRARKPNPARERWRELSRIRREARSPAHSLFFNQLRPGRRAPYRRQTRARLRFLMCFPTYIRSPCQRPASRRW